MEVLQKITVYDLLGYTVPGTIMVCVIQICFCTDKVSFEIIEQHLGYYFAIIIVLGYVMGMILSEVSNILYGIINLFPKLMKKINTNINKFLGEKEELCTVGCELVTKALIDAGVVKNNQILSEKEVKNYYGFMYADIQSDSRYSRIHDYASSELVCKNLAIVIAVSAILLYKCKLELVQLNTVGLVFFLVGAVLLYIRGIKQMNRKLDYTLDWFIQKHCKS